MGKSIDTKVAAGVIIVVAIVAVGVVIVRGFGVGAKTEPDQKYSGGPPPGAVPKNYGTPPPGYSKGGPPGMQSQMQRTDSK